MTSMILKTNLHFHTANDEKAVRYDIYQGIDYAKERGFDVLAYTSHKKFGFRQEYADYAAKKGILLIPGIEAEIKRKHVVILNCNKGAEELKTFKEFADYKKKNPQIFILAPHPFVFSLKSLYSKLLKNIDLFDAIELTVFSNKIFNFNKKAREVAEKYQKPLIASSDTHFLKDLNRGYAWLMPKKKLRKASLPPLKKEILRTNSTIWGFSQWLNFRLNSCFTRFSNRINPLFRNPFDSNFEKRYY